MFAFINHVQDNTNKRNRVLIQILFIGTTTIHYKVTELTLLITTLNPNNVSMG